MNETIDKKAALEYVISIMKKCEEYKGIEEADISRITAQAIEADFAYMDKANVNDGGVYDEDDAYDYIMEILTKGKDDETSALISLIVDGYLEYFDEYLEKNDLIDWE